MQQRDAPSVILDLEGKANRVRTATNSSGVNAGLDQWTAAAGITEERIFRPVTKAGAVEGTEILDEKWSGA